MTKHPNPRWSMPRDSRKRAEVAIEQAIARHGTPYKAAEELGLPDEDVLQVWRQMQEALADEDVTVARPRAVCAHPCGTYPAYQFHMSHGEPVDDACKAVGNARSREYARRMAERRRAA